MRKTLAVAAATAALVLVPTASALAQEQAPTVAGAQSVVLAQDANEDQDQESDKTGLWGLLGLAGLAGLIKRKTTEHTNTR